MPVFSTAGALAVYSLRGTADGAPFEISAAAVASFSDGHFSSRMDWYDLDQLAAAFERYDEIVAARNADPFEKAAARFVRALVEAWNAQEWAQVDRVLDGITELTDNRASTLLGDTDLAETVKLLRDEAHTTA